MCIELHISPEKGPEVKVGHGGLVLGIMFCQLFPIDWSLFEDTQSFHQETLCGAESSPENLLD